MRSILVFRFFLNKFSTRENKIHFQATRMYIKKFRNDFLRFLEIYLKRNLVQNTELKASSLLLQIKITKAIKFSWSFMEGEKKKNENFYYIYAHFLYINRNVSVWKSLEFFLLHVLLRFVFNRLHLLISKKRFLVWKI